MQQDSGGFSLVFWRGATLPFPLKALVQSSPVNTYNPRRLLQYSGPKSFAISEMLISFLCFPDPVSRNMFSLILWAWNSRITKMSVSGDLTTAFLYPKETAWCRYKMTLVSVSSWLLYTAGISFTKTWSDRIVIDCPENRKAYPFLLGKELNFNSPDHLMVWIDTLFLQQPALLSLFSAVLMLLVNCSTFSAIAGTAVSCYHHLQGISWNHMAFLLQVLPRWFFLTNHV